jgi:hypothetical protein
MRSFTSSLKETVAAVVLSCFIAGGVSAMTYPAVSATAENNAISVNRIHKGDRLPLAALTHRYPINSSSTQAAPPSPKRTPLGCDPAFSTVVEPALAHIFKRCLV